VEAWIEAAGQVVTDFAMKVLDLIEWAWKKAIAPRNE
jgi:hypothetical protein